MEENPTTSQGNAARGGGKTALFIAIGVSAVLMLLPFSMYRLVAWPLSLFLTFAHEMGHGLTAMLLGGNFEKFVMWPDGSGTAYFSLARNARIGTAITAAGGLVGPAVLASIYFRMARNPKTARLALGILSAFCFLSALLVVRNSFGFAYVLSVGAVSGLFAAFAPERIAHFATTFLAVQLSVSVYQRSDYLFMESAGPGQPSDVAQMANALLLPYWFWGFTCAAFSAFVLWRGVRGLLKDR